MTYVQTLWGDQRQGLLRESAGGYIGARTARCHSSGVEHFIGNEEVLGSIPSDSTIGLPMSGLATGASLV
jgi:hypothetical protein